MSETNPPSCFYTYLGRFFKRYPVLILLITISLSITLSWFGLAQNGFPEFGDPYLGFQTRFTNISNRLISLDNLRLELKRMDSLENYPGERRSEKESKRKRRSSDSNSMCTGFPLEEYGRVALELKNFTSTSHPPLLTREGLSLICYFQQEILTLPSYFHVCEFDENRQCCPIWSLPNYVAQFSNKSDCVDISTEDVERFKQGLAHCSNFYANSSTNEDCLFRRSTCPSACHHGGMLHSALVYTLGGFPLAKNGAKYTMIILPVPKSSREQVSGVMESFQKSVWKLGDSLPSQMGQLVGFDFGGKDAIFESYLVSDLQYVGLACVIIFGTVLIFTNSLLVTVISFGILLLSLGTSYYFYKTVFGIQYFPFMNMLVTIILLGIGTDATLIVSSAWKRFSAGPKGVELGKRKRETVMVLTLQETTVTLFITTCTTAGAFFASLTSSITTIRCFSIFAGTAIITSFFLLYVCVPIGLDCSERVWEYLKSLLPSSQSKLIQKFIKFGSRFSHRNFGCAQQGGRWFSASSGLFWTFSFVFCACVLAWSTFVLFYSPGFQLPDSEQFQLLSTSHPIEMYDRLVAPNFGDPVPEEKLTVYLVWGLRPLDTGNGLDPKNFGSLEFDPHFSLVPPENQKWMKRLCKRILKTSFYDVLENGRVGLNLDSCFMDTFVAWMKRDCHHFVGNGNTYKPCCSTSKFPYDNATFLECIGLAARDVYRTPSLYFIPDIAGPKFFTGYPSRQIGTPEPDLATGKNLATFTVRIRTNVTSSLVYEKMDKVYKEFERSFQEILRDAPEGLENGFFVSSHFDFYDLQKSLMEETSTSFFLSIGLCFFFLLISSRSFAIAAGAVLSIFAIVLVTAGVLITFFNWKLGVFESIAITVAVGLSDFTAHHSIEFSKEKSVTNMTGPTFFSALSTVVMGLSMFLFSSVLVYQQIGSFFVVLVVTSWIYSVFFLSPVLIVLDILAHMGASLFMAIFCGKVAKERKDSLDNNEDSNSHSDLILENVNVTRVVPEKKPNLMMEKWKRLKKLKQETPV